MDLLKREKSEDTTLCINLFMLHCCSGRHRCHYHRQHSSFSLATREHIRIDVISCCIVSFVAFCGLGYLCGGCHHFHQKCMCCLSCPACHLLSMEAVSGTYPHSRRFTSCCIVNVTDAGCLSSNIQTGFTTLHHQSLLAVSNK